MCAYQFIYTTKLNQLTESEFFYGVPNLVFYFKLEGARASPGLSLLMLCVDVGYKQWSNDRPLHT